MNRIAKIATFTSFLIAALTAAIAGIEPSPFVNFQGVLRDAADRPLSGTYDMTFRFFNAASGGNEILVDRHLAAGTGAVQVSHAECVPLLVCCRSWRGSPTSRVKPLLLPVTWPE